MVSLLARIFIKNRDVSVPETRRAYGMLSSIVGILLNICLFMGKYIIGLISGSIAITADAFNNLSDAGSSVITLIGFKFAGKKADADHPYGHGRIEYVSGLVVSGIIMLMGFELFKTSVMKIIKPEQVDASAVAIVILVVSICIKLYMFWYNISIGKKINSAAMKATAIDSFSDCVATFVVLLTTVITIAAGINLDGFGGIVVAIFILIAGFNSAKDTVGPLLGQPPSSKFVQEIKEIVMAHKEIMGIHDLIVHDYGPGRVFVSLHGEVSGKEDIYKIHDTIDRIEQELNTKLGCEAVIHMDPIETDNENIARLKKEVEELIAGYNNRLSIHDFRVVTGTTQTNLIFDVLAPFDVKTADEVMEKDIQNLIHSRWECYYGVIKIDRAYTKV